MDGDGVGVCLGQSGPEGSRSMRGAIVYDPKHPASRSEAFPAHDLAYQCPKTYVVSRDGYPLSPFRFADHPVEGFVNTWVTHALFNGASEATGVYENYSGVPVLAAAELIPNLNWVVVAEIKRSDVLLPVRRLAWITLGQGALLGLLAVAVALFLSGRILRRLPALQLAATEVARGRWDVQVAIDGQDELAALGAAFNRMTTAIAAALSALRVSQAKLGALLDVAPDAIIAVDESQKIVLFNQVAEQVFGYTSTEVIAQPLSILVPSSYGATHAVQVQRFAAAPGIARQMSGDRGEIRGRRKNGEEFPAEVSIARLQSEGETLLISVLRDVTQKKQMESQLIQMANHDPLTGLFNGRRLELELEQTLAQAPGRNGAVIWLDLDQFRYVNASRSYQAGDELLKGLAALLREQVRETDILARQGSDRFALLVCPASLIEAQVAAEGILSAIRHTPFLAGGQPVRVTASAGIALFPDHGTTAQELFACADLALHQAKEAGRDMALVFTPTGDPRPQMESKLIWEHRIREALEKDRFVLYAQPILNLHTDQISHYELLLRMLGPGGEIIPPGDFLGVAERFGLIHAIDRWVVCQAIRLLADPHGISRGLGLAVNLSGKVFENRELLPLIQQEIARAAIDCRMLTLEITETAAIVDLDRARAFVTDLKGLGFELALDDFGVGFSSFRHLKDLPVDYLKIDGSFIRDLAGSTTDQHLVKSMVEVARGLGKRTIAEFVGDAQTVTLLRRFGVDCAQGYHIGRPQPVAELLLARSKGLRSST